MAPSHRVRFCLFVCFFFCFFFFYVTEAERRCLQCTDFDGLSPVEVHVASPSSRSGVDSGQQGQSGQQRRSPAPVEVHSFFFQKGTHFFDAESADRRVKSGRKLPRRVIYSPTSTSSLGRSAILICYSTAAPSTTLDPS